MFDFLSGGIFFKTASGLSRLAPSPENSSTVGKVPFGRLLRFSQELPNTTRITLIF
jgi:hypothetical protein